MREVGLGWKAGFPEPLSIVMRFALFDRFLCETLGCRVLMKPDPGTNKFLRPLHCTRHASMSVSEIILDRREKALPT